MIQAAKNSGTSTRALTRLRFRESPVPAYVVSQVASSEQIHDEIEVVPVLECELHVDNESNNHNSNLLMVELCK